MILGRRDLARYPFLSDTARLVADEGVPVDAIGTDPDYSAYLDLAMERVAAAAAGGVFPAADPRAEGRDDSVRREVFSFLLAVMLLKLAGRQTLIRRFALAEARRAERYLESSLREEFRHPHLRGALPARAILESFSLRVSASGDEFSVPVADYLERAVHFHEREWRLVNRRVSGGRVFLSPRTIARLARAGLSVHIREKILAARAPPMLPLFRPRVEALAELASGLEPRYEQSGESPPCVKHAIAALERGENLPHSGRFLLGTFLLGRGQTPDQIAPLFRGAPDYNERVTAYQLRSLSEGAGGEGYSCPSCETLRGRDLCFETAECAGISSPMQFGARRAR